MWDFTAASPPKIKVKKVIQRMFFEGTREAAMPWWLTAMMMMVVSLGCVVRGISLGTSRLVLRGPYEQELNDTLYIAEEAGVYGSIVTPDCAVLRGNLSFTIMDTRPISISPRLIIDAACTKGAFSHVIFAWDSTLSGLLPWMPYEGQLVFRGEKQGKVYLLIQDRSHPVATSIAALGFLFCMAYLIHRRHRVNRKRVWGTDWDTHNV